ncbi:bifunctional cobinamide kinase/cobinamide phosphate guanylyltransferase [Virgibacillus sp. SK37]|nr:bifunctional cobinamide kinase/cobinamide phosphate guanylyltransferase [Virgibacillus sp. SK37]
MIFISGGVRSGKSSFAERMATELHLQLPNTKLHYIACGVASDKEMTERIARHQKDRQASNANWETWECAYDVYKIASAFGKSDILVLDCVTTLLNNYLFGREMEDTEQVMQHMWKDISSLSKTGAEVVLVSNEVVQGVPYSSELVQRYQYILGTLHQRIVKEADTAYLVEAGIPVCMKGEKG